jgi:carbonic anhydrase
MDKLFKGILEFQQEDFENQRELFSSLGRSQDPHTLFIGCSDSRVVPTMITNTNPGELFLVRNVANIVPPFGNAVEGGSTAAAIEFAVQALHVDTIVVCGHSNCGGCAALYLSAAEMEHLPTTRRWLEFSREVPARVTHLLRTDSPAEREWLTEQINILVQMRNLRTYPYIAEKVAAGSLNILGWHYVIETGDVLNFNDAKGHFERVT